MKKILITSALPYANGSIHFGHIAGAYLPADVFTRFKKMSGFEAIHVSGTDEHGFAITVSAKKEKKDPQEHVDHYHEVIKGVFSQFNIEFDHFSRTSHQAHGELSQQFFKKLLSLGKISQKETEQFFCDSCNLFLADRYVCGVCPHCYYDDARGDECEKCGEWLDALQVHDAKCKICENSPSKKPTKHWFLNLNLFSDELSKWIHAKKGLWKSNVTYFISSMIERGLEARAITRDMDWGIPVPVEGGEGKVLYVWFEAPIGYISATKEWAKKIKKPDEWKSFWKNPECELIHFIGKDNLPFHCVVWPAILKGQEDQYILPTNVPANEFYHLEGKAFSKSRNWYINLEHFFSRYEADSIRYAIASNAPETKDSTFRWKHFQAAHNTELADVLGNFVHRVFVFTQKYAENKMPPLKEISLADNQSLKQLQEQLTELKNNYESFQLRKACSTIMSIAREGNKYFDEKAPWSTRKTNFQDCLNTLGIGLIRIYNLAYGLAPILPNTSKKIYQIFQLPVVKKINFSVLQIPKEHLFGEVKILFSKISDEQIEKEELSLKQKVNE